MRISQPFRKARAGAVATAALACALGAQAVAARPLTPAEKREYSFSGALPACNDSFVLSKISGKFHARESHYWASGLKIAAFDKIVEIGMRSPGLDFIPRRYCMAHVVFDDGSARKANYAIVESMGWLGVLGFGVEWCIDGLDRHRAYGGECRAARP